MPHMKRNANGLGSIRKKKITRNGKIYEYWEGRYTVGYCPETGRQIQKSVTGKTQKEVVEKMRQMTVERSDGIVPLSCRMTVGEWMEVWEKDFLGDVKESTAYLYKRSVELYIVKYLGAIKLDGLTALMIQRFYNRLIEPESESVRALSAKSVRNIHGILHKALQQAVQIGYLPKNPADGCKPPRAEKKEIQPLNENQIQLFLAEIQGHPHEYLYKIALFTGIREGEILGLTWDCVDFERGTLRIRQQLRRQQKKGGTYYLSSPKNGKCRMITLPPSVLHLFQLQKGKQNEMRFRARELWTENNLVFTNQIGGYLSYRTVYDCFKRIMGKIGAPDARFHDLRHTYAVLALQGGDDIKTVQATLGHATAAFTLDVYGHVTGQMQRDSAARMESMIRRIAAK